MNEEQFIATYGEDTLSAMRAFLAATGKLHFGILEKPHGKRLYECFSKLSDIVDAVELGRVE